MTAEQITAARDAALRPWISRTSERIVRRVRDARRHAEAGFPDVAHLRLTELQGGLWNDLSNARAWFYHQAFAVHRLGFDPGVHQEIHPDQAGEHVARTAQIGTVDHYAGIDQHIEDARRSLRLAVNAGTGLEGWELRHRHRLTAHVRGALSDSQVGLHEAIGHLMIKPELR